MQDEEDYEEIAQDTSQNPTNDSPTVIAMTTNICYLDHQVSHMTSNMSYNRLQIVPPAQVVMTTNESYATLLQDNVDNDYEELL